MPQAERLNLPSLGGGRLVQRDRASQHHATGRFARRPRSRSVYCALKRARASLRHRLPPTGEREPPPAPDSPAEQALAAKFLRAYESGDLDALVTLLTADVRLSMPPIPLEYHSRCVVACLFASVLRQGRPYDLVPRRANGQPAFGPLPAASARGAASTCSPSPATGSAPSLASRRACSHGSGCRDRSLADHHLSKCAAGRSTTKRASQRTSENNLSRKFDRSLG